MAKYSPVAPITLLASLEQRNCLGDYVLMLAHDVIAFPRKYEKLAYDLRQRNKHATIIMDNSLIELGRPVSPATMIEAARIVQANVLTLPDVLQSFEGTRKLCKDWMREMNKVRDRYQLMGVVQGANCEDQGQCTAFYGEVIKPEWWSVPRIVANTEGSREPLITHIVDMYTPSDNSPFNIHLLGMSRSLDDDIRCAMMSYVRGIDSANPLVLGQRGIDISTDFKHVDRGDFWDSRRLEDMTVSNIKYIRACLGH